VSARHVAGGPDVISMHTKEMDMALSYPVGDQSSEIPSATSDILVTADFVSDC